MTFTETGERKPRANGLFFPPRHNRHHVALKRTKTMRILSISALTLAAALSVGAASAQSINPGVAQIAALIGVSANDY